ncbi:hypothetical protein [Spirosoma aerophilum]
MKDSLVYLTCFFLLFVVIHSKAQTNEERAKSAYLNAESAFDSRKFQDAIKSLYRAKEYLGRTTPVIQYLLIKSYYNDQNYIEAKQELSIYFHTIKGYESNEGDRYKEMLELVDEVSSKAKVQNTIQQEAVNLSGRYEFYDFHSMSSCANEHFRPLSVSQQSNLVTVEFQSGFGSSETKEHPAIFKGNFTFEQNFTFYGIQATISGSQVVNYTISQADFSIEKVYSLPVSYNYNITTANGFVEKTIEFRAPCFFLGDVRNNGKIVNPRLSNNDFRVTFKQRFPVR